MKKHSVIVPIKVEFNDLENTGFLAVARSSVSKVRKELHKKRDKLSTSKRKQQCQRCVPTRNT